LIDIGQYDFRQQLYRKTCHELFTVIVSQFYREEPYSVIVKDIKKNMDRPVYSQAIRECRFKGSAKALLMSFSMKYRLIFLMYLYSKLK